jgi:transcription elongation factor/antiterminator RfaH
MNPINPTNPINPINPINPTNPMNPINPQWYVIQTKPGQEHRVEMNLLNQEIEIFLPLIETCPHPSRQTVRRIKPLFPNYLFARLDLHLHYYKVKYTRGVNKILGSGSEPVPISQKVIETVKERMGKDNLVKLEDTWREGDLVRIHSGPFRDLTGIFQKKMSDKGRVRILLNLIGVEVPVQISQWQLRKVA